LKERKKKGRGTATSESGPCLRKFFYHSIKTFHRSGKKGKGKKKIAGWEGGKERERKEPPPSGRTLLSSLYIMVILLG